jgi:hypothetical protein
MSGRWADFASENTSACTNKWTGTRISVAAPVVSKSPIRVDSVSIPAMTMAIDAGTGAVRILCPCNVDRNIQEYRQ